MTVLVLTEDLDPTADQVTELLTTAGVPVLRCDTGWFPQQLSLDAELCGNEIRGHLTTPDRSVPLSQLRSVWYRRPTAFTFPSSWSTLQRRHAAHEAKYGLGGVLWSLPVLWVNHPARQADLYKPTQLAMAARCGLSVPDTVVTNDPDRVLEIGVGTGFNAALLCHRLGDSQVTTCDIDPVLVAEAQAHLAAAGHRPVVETGDGSGGLAGHGPYDRILCATTVPKAWITQLRPDGRIVASLTFGGALAVLRKTAPDRVTGRLDEEQVYFMPLHEPGRPYPDGFVVDRPHGGDPQATRHGTTSIPLHAWADPDWRLWLAIHLPGSHLADKVDEQLNRTGVVVYDSQHQASVDYSRGEMDHWPVAQDQARMWDTVEAAWAAWQRHEQPDRSRIGVTAIVDGPQWVWLDHEDGPLQLPLGG